MATKKKKEKEEFKIEKEVAKRYFVASGKSVKCKRGMLNEGELITFKDIGSCKRTWDHFLEAEIITDKKPVK